MGQDRHCSAGDVRRIEIDADPLSQECFDDFTLAMLARVALACAALISPGEEGSDWQSGEGLSPQGKYRPVWYNVRESGEAALAQLMDQGRRSRLSSRGC